MNFIKTIKHSQESFTVQKSDYYVELIELLSTIFIWYDDIISANLYINNDSLEYFSDINYEYINDNEISISGFNQNRDFIKIVYQRTVNKNHSISKEIFYCNNKKEFAIILHFFNLPNKRISKSYFKDFKNSENNISMEITDFNPTIPYSQKKMFNIKFTLFNNTIEDSISATVSKKELFDKLYNIINDNCETPTRIKGLHLELLNNELLREEVIGIKNTFINNYDDTEPWQWVLDAIGTGLSSAFGAFVSAAYAGLSVWTCLGWDL